MTKFAELIVYADVISGMFEWVLLLVLVLFGMCTNSYSAQLEIIAV